MNVECVFCIRYISIHQTMNRGLFNFYLITLKVKFREIEKNIQMKKVEIIYLLFLFLSFLFINYNFISACKEVKCIKTQFCLSVDVIATKCC